MPKISNKNLRIQEGDINENFDFTVYYNSEFEFYAELPEGLNESFDQLTDPELKALSATKKYKYKFNVQGGHKRIVWATTEEGVVKAMRAIIVKLLAVTIQKKAMIIVRFEDRSSRDKDREDVHELPGVGMELSATYCFEVSTGTGKSKYYTYTERDWFGEKKIDRQEVYIGRREEGVTIIPDTPDNRQFIEDLHKALLILVDKMAKFTKTPAAMLKMIEGRQKLLN